MKWEEFKNEGEPFTMYRTKVLGGWLVTIRENVVTDIVPATDKSSTYYEKGIEFRTSVTFVPDPAYQWRLDKSV
jgi:hypothetical protein